MQFILDFAKLIKFRVNIIVVLSSIFGYLIGLGTTPFSFSVLIGISLGGFFTTGAAHAINQLIELKHDAKMQRTKDRPLPTGRMKRNHVMFYAITMSVLGFLFFFFLTNTLTVIISMASLFIYAFLYTPLKRISPIAVVVGAIPGALPPTIGVVAATNSISILALVLFAVQFVWQFPHFWSIAWIYNDDYHTAGYKLLPTKNGRTKKNALITFASSILLIPSLFLFYFFDLLNITTISILLILTFWFITKAYKFYKTPNMTFAKKLMLGSVIYLPILQLILVIAFWNN